MSMSRSGTNCGRSIGSPTRGCRPPGFRRVSVRVNDPPGLWRGHAADTSPGLRRGALDAAGEETVTAIPVMRGPCADDSFSPYPDQSRRRRRPRIGGRRGAPAWRARSSSWDIRSCARHRRTKGSPSSTHIRVRGRRPRLGPSATGSGVPVKPRSPSFRASGAQPAHARIPGGGSRGAPGAAAIGGTCEVHGYLHPLAETPETTARRLDFAVRQYYAAWCRRLRARPANRRRSERVGRGRGSMAARRFGGTPWGPSSSGCLAIWRARISARVCRSSATGSSTSALRRIRSGARRASSAPTGVTSFSAGHPRRTASSSPAPSRATTSSSSTGAASLRGARRDARRRAAGLSSLPATAWDGGPIPPWCLAPGHIRELIDHSP